MEVTLKFTEDESDLLVLALHLLVDDYRHQAEMEKCAEAKEAAEEAAELYRKVYRVVTDTFNPEQQEFRMIVERMVELFKKMHGGDQQAHLN